MNIIILHFEEGKSTWKLPVIIWKVHFKAFKMLILSFDMDRKREILWLVLKLEWSSQQMTFIYRIDVAINYRYVTVSHLTVKYLWSSEIVIQSRFKKVWWINFLLDSFNWKLNRKMEPVENVHISFYVNLNSSKYTWSRFKMSLYHSM